MKIIERTEPLQTITLQGVAKIFLTVTVGNRQIGGAILQFEGDSDPFKKGRIKNLSFDDVNSLNGKCLVIRTNIIDSNPINNRVVFTHKFFEENGNEIKSFVVKDELTEHNDVLSSSAYYTFSIL